MSLFCLVFLFDCAVSACRRLRSMALTTRFSTHRRTSSVQDVGQTLADLVTQYNPRVPFGNSGGGGERRATLVPSVVAGPSGAAAKRSPSDEEVALRMQVEYMKNALQAIDDERMARSLDEGVEANHPSLNMLSRADQQSTADMLLALEILLEESEPGCPGEGDDLNNAPGPSCGELERRCIVCDEVIGRAAHLFTPCDHTFCRACVTDFMEACMKDESLFPPQCCNHQIPANDITPFLTQRHLAFYNAKMAELQVPAENRVYCPNPTCSAFMGSSAEPVRDLHCRQCGTDVCSGCKLLAHPGESCTDNAEIIQVREYAKARGWQTCPNCKAIIELTSGCYHMTCRCRTEFCYQCAIRWKRCNC